MGYHQIDTEEGKGPKMAFSTKQGHWEYKRLPFGLKTALATFQKLMNTTYVTDKMVKKAFSDDIMSRPHTPEGYSTFKDGHNSMQKFECSSCPSLIWTN